MHAVESAGRPAPTEADGPDEHHGRSDRVLVEAILGGDEDAFSAVVDRYSGVLFRVARQQVGSAVLAEEVLQETWIALLGSLRRFEWRCSLKTWLFTILIRCARKVRERESRAAGRVAAPATWDGAGGADGADGDRFFPADHRWAGAWRMDAPERLPTGWRSVPEERLLAREACDVVETTVSTLAPAQREVFVLRDVHGCTPEETCEILALTATNQRVLLHRARTRIRAALDRYFQGSPT